MEGWAGRHTMLGSLTQGCEDCTHDVHDMPMRGTRVGFFSAVGAAPAAEEHKQREGTREAAPNKDHETGLGARVCP